MIERPILFSAPMVLALLAGTKTQTRRIVGEFGAAALDAAFFYAEGQAWRDLAADPIGFLKLKSPYGEAGDHLWVRETWRSAKSLDHLSPAGIGDAALAANYSKPWAPLEYVADGLRVNWESSFGKEPGKTRVSIHMPRWASRITLEVVSVRIERLHEISEKDATAEGFSPLTRDCKVPKYRALWESINGPDSWELDPWVWVITFNRRTA